MKKVFLMSLLVCLACWVPGTMAQFSVGSLGTAYTVDFDNTVNGVNNSPFESASASPLFVENPAAGQLDALAWAIVLDNADTTTMNPAAFPGTGNGNFGTLAAPGVGSVGWGAWNLSGDHGLGMLPSGSWSTPAGQLTLKAVNNTGSMIENLEISYYVAAYNDQPRSNKVLFFYSFDNAAYTKVPEVSFYSGLASTGNWEFATMTVNLNGLSLINGQEFFLRWVFADHSGSGSRDEFLLDDITVTGTAGGTPLPEKLAVTNVNNNVQPSVGASFPVTIQAQNAAGTPVPVTTATQVSLSLNAGNGNLGGNLQGILEAGNHTLVLEGVLYDMADNGVEIKATATGLTDGISAPFNVLLAADHLAFVNFPLTGTYGVNLVSTLPTFYVHALRPDATPDSNFAGNASLSVFSGPGNLLGTTVKPFTSGMAAFNDIRVDQPGTYIFMVTGNNLPAAYSEELVITEGPGMVELVVPQYFGSKHASSANNCRTPYAVCLNFTNLEPDSPYDLRISLALTTEAVTVFGAGNTWNGTTFSGSNSLNAFTTDGEGNTGPIWFYLQPTGNATRFDAGQVHQLRAAVVPSGSAMPFSPMFIGAKTLTALDIPVTPRTAETTDDGAFVKGVLDTTQTGKIFLLYNNVGGNGDPLYSFQVRTIEAYTTFANAELPGEIDSVWRELPVGVKGEFAAVLPIGENNPDGLRRVELRDAGNNITGFSTDDDGIWPGGGISTTLYRREVLHLFPEDMPTTATISGVVTYDNTSATLMDSTEVGLFDPSGTMIKSAWTNGNGEYTLTGVPLGNYTLKAMPDKVPGGFNAIDALACLKHFVGMQVLTGLPLKAADVSGGTPVVVNSVDALMIQKRFVLMINTFTIGDWVSENPALNVSEITGYNVNLKVLCAGDANASYVPL